MTTDGAGWQDPSPSAEPDGGAEVAETAAVTDPDVPTGGATEPEPGQAPGRGFVGAFARVVLPEPAPEPQAFDVEAAADEAGRYLDDLLAEPDEAEIAESDFDDLLAEPDEAEIAESDSDDLLAETDQAATDEADFDDLLAEPEEPELDEADLDEAALGDLLAEPDGAPIDEAEIETGPHEAAVGAPGGGAAGGTLPELTPDVLDAELLAVEAALARLDAGEYGRCEVCFVTLDDAVLAADPTVAVCPAHVNLRPAVV